MKTKKGINNHNDDQNDSPMITFNSTLPLLFIYKIMVSSVVLEVVAKRIPKSKFLLVENVRHKPELHVFVSLSEVCYPPGLQRAPTNSSPPFRWSAYRSLADVCFGIFAVFLNQINVIESEA